MENKIVTAIFKDSTHTKVSDVWQYDYGQILRIQGLDLPTAVEVDFAVAGASESIARIGTTKDGVTDVVIPDSLIETGNNLVAYIYLRDAESGNTEYQIDMFVTKRAKPEAYNTPEDKELFGQAIEAVNTAADRAEKAGQAAQEAAQKAGLDAEQTAQDRAEVAKMVETVTDISEQVKKVEELSNKAQESATQAGASAVATEKAKAQAETAAGKTAEDRIAVNQAKIAVDEVQEAVRADRAAVEEVKQSVEQLSNAIPESTQAGVQAVNQARQTAVDEIARTGISHKTAVEGAGTQAVENVENVKASAIEAVETAKTEAVQSVQTEGNTQTGNVTTEGTKQVKAVQDKGNEVLQSIPEDFQMQMESKLDKQQGVENKGKVLVIGEDGNVVPEEVASGGGDGIAIINTMSGESPLVIPDSAERVNKRLELGGKTEQVQTTGKNLFDTSFAKNKENYKEVTIAGSVIYAIELSLKPNTKYAFQCVIKSVPTTMNVGNSTIRYVVSDGQKRVITTNEDGKLYIGFSGNPDGEIHKIGVSIVDIQVEESTTVTPYEPYTGGKPSPSPEYPQEIKNSGKWNEETQKYEIDVKVTGKNLLNLQKEPDVKGLYQGWKVGNGDKGTLSIKDKGNNADISECYFGLNSDSTTSNSVTWLVDNGVIKRYYIESIEKMYACMYPPNETIIKKITERFEIQYEYGSIATEYQPYKEQLLTLTSDRPITKWDKLVEQGGQIGWLYQSEIDDNVKPSRTDLFPHGFSLYKNQENGTYTYKSTNIKKAIGFQTSYCKQFRNKDAAYQSAELWHYSDQPSMKIQYFNTDIATVEEFIEWMESNPLTMVFKTESATFVPLPQSEQNAIRALKTYYPTTVITVDGGEVDPDIKVTYTADTKNYIDNKVSAKVASIIRQYRLNTANLLSLMPMETQAAMIENDTNNILENAEEMKHE